MTGVFIKGELWTEFWIGRMRSAWMKTAVCVGFGLVCAFFCLWFLKKFLQGWEGLRDYDDMDKLAKSCEK
jgi:uncharacterized membrane protein YqhA